MYFKTAHSLSIIYTVSNDYGIPSFISLKVKATFNQ